MNPQISNNEAPVVETRSEPGCLIQILWLVLVGWWAGGIATAVAWFLNATIIGLPIGLMILNNLPTILALQNPSRVVYARYGRKGPIVLTATDQPQYPFLIRAAYFLLIGWWWSGIWLGVAYALSVTIVLLPVALEMIRLTPFMTTLRRY